MSKKSADIVLTGSECGVNKIINILTLVDLRSISCKRPVCQCLVTLASRSLSIERLRGLLSHNIS